MCSIFGIIGEYDINRAKEAFESLAHRGQDSSKIVSFDNAFFGSHRLAIESIDKIQNQPLKKDGFIALFNGEIYNYKELIDKFNLDANDEIETILELFIRGYNLHDILRGMYAIAIYKISSKELWLFRDLAGKKPIYFTNNKDSFIFASEVKAIEKILGFSLDKRAIHHYLGHGTTIAPYTIFKNIQKLPPANILYFKNNEIELKNCESFLDNAINILKLDDAKTQLELTLKESIEIRIPNKVEWGVLLSGGLDSSLISAISNSLSKKKINLFSIGYDGFKKYDERKYAKEVANYLDANFFEFNFTKDDFFNTINEMLDLIDDPIGDPAQIPLYFLIKKAKSSGIKVLLSGDGSDELFLGYRTYKEYYMMESVKNLPYKNWLKNHLRANFSLNKEWEWYKRALKDEVIFRSSAEIYTDRQLNKLLRLQEKDNKNFEPLNNYWQKYLDSNRNIIDWYSYCDLKVQLAEFFLTKIDRVSMANGVEVRSPFLDKNMIELIFKIDFNLRFNPTNPKEILKNIATKYLPTTIINRKKKGLNYPFIEWILEENGIDVIFEANKKFRLFKQEHLEFLSSKSKSGKFKQHLFPLYILSFWLLKNEKSI